MLNKNILVLASGFVILFLVLVNGYLNKKDLASSDILDSDKELKSKLLEEFKSAYPVEANLNGQLVEFKMNAAPGEIEIFDGYKTKVWAYNGQVPGPEIRIKLGNTLRINFENNLPQETTIHFHGVRVPNAMDGVPGVTQAPIKPGESFVYEFTPKDPGTYWFHPHVRSSEQIERGLFGVLIVEDEFTDKYSQDKVFVLDDWRLTQDAQVYPYFDTPMDIMHDGRWGNVITVNGHLNEVLDVRPGERIRLRLINTSNARVYKPRFSGDLKVFVSSVDGMYVREAFPLEEIQDLAPGNRLDLDITIPKNASGKAFELYDEFSGKKIKLASIKVKGSPVETPDFPIPTNKKVPHWSEAYKIKPDKIYRLNIRRKMTQNENREGVKRGRDGMGMMGGMQLEWTINGKAYPDYDPFTFKYKEFNVAQFVNESYRMHPMHLHGQFFKVIARNGKPVDEPFFRDTVLIYPRESVSIATVPLDKGKWMNHCHILEHAEAGMMTIVEVK